MNAINIICLYQSFVVVVSKKLQQPREQIDSDLSQLVLRSYKIIQNKTAKTMTAIAPFWLINLTKICCNFINSGRLLSEGKDKCGNGKTYLPLSKLMLGSSPGCSGGVGVGGRSEQHFPGFHSISSQAKLKVTI